MANRFWRFSPEEKSLAVLIDPDKFYSGSLTVLEDTVKKYAPSYFFVGGSFLTRAVTEKVIDTLKSRFSLPVILFPGDYAQLTPKADAVLFLSLLSGRNPEYLAGQQVKAAPLLYQWQIPVLSTGYILVDSGSLTTVQYLTQTLPVPRTKPDLAVATALAAQMMGMQNVYLEAGSGAERPVPLEMVKQVREHITVPLIVGGGISVDRLTDYFEAGANVVVIGTYFENNS